MVNSAFASELENGNDLTISPDYEWEVRISNLFEMLVNTKMASGAPSYSNKHMRHMRAYKEHRERDAPCS